MHHFKEENPFFSGGGGQSPPQTPPPLGDTLPTPHPRRCLRRLHSSAGTRTPSKPHFWLRACVDSLLNRRYLQVSGSVRVRVRVRARARISARVTDRDRDGI